MPRTGAWRQGGAVGSVGAVGVGWGGRVFDFEERAAGNFDELPRFWYVIGRDPLASDPNFLRQPLHRELTDRSGYRRHAKVRLEDLTDEKGQALRVSPDGGDAGAYLQVGAASAVPGATYEVTCRVRTTDLTRAGAVVTAYFVNDAGARIDASVVRSEPIRTRGGWRDIELTLVGDAAWAAWIGIELSVQQGDVGEGVRVRDVHGSAWFDDIAIARAAHADLTTQSPVNVVRGPDLPRITATLRDVVGTRLQATLTVTDMGGTTVDEQTRLIGGDPSARLVFQPGVPAFGWYRATLRVVDAGRAEGKPLAAATTTLVYLPPRDPAAAAARGGPRLGVTAGEGDEAFERSLPELVRVAGLDALTLPLLGSGDDRMGVLERGNELQERVMDARAAGVEMTFMLPAWPWEERERGRVVDLLARFGGQVDRWALWRDAGDVAPVPEVERLLGRYVRRPRLVVDEAWKGAEAGEGDDVVLRVDGNIAASDLGERLDRLRAAGRMDGVTLEFSAAGDEGDSLQDSQNLLLHLLAAWEAQPAGVMLDRPWGDGDAAAVQPTPAVAVLANAGERLRGRRVVGQLPLAEGLVGLVLAGERGGRDGAVVLWNRSRAVDDPEARLAMHLGELPEAVDLWGNRRALALVAEVDEEGVGVGMERHELTLTRVPVFVEGIDTELARLRASLAVDEPFVAAVRRPHERVLMLTNPWPSPLTGELRLAGLPGWRVSPVLTSVRLAGGETLRLPIELTPPAAPATGEQMLSANLTFQMGRSYDVTLETPLTVGLEGLRLEARLAGPPDPSGAVVVEAEVWNTGLLPRAVKLFAVMPGRARQERLVPLVETGSSQVRRFTFDGVTAEDLAGGVLRAGVIETDGPGLLTQRVVE